MNNNAYISLNPDFSDKSFKLLPDSEAFTRYLPFEVYYLNYKDTKSLIDTPPSLLVSTDPKMILMDTK